MQIYLFLWLAAVIFLNGWSAGEVSAQSPKAVEVEVEFDFRVGDVTYPAGAYRFEAASPSVDNLLHLRSLGKEDRQRLIVAGSINAGRPQRPKLVFRQIGATYYLCGVYLNGDGWGYSLPVPRRGQGKNPAGKNPAGKTVEVAAVN